MRAKLEIVFERYRLPAEKALAVIHSIFSERGLPLQGFKLYGKPVDLAQPVSRILKVAGRPHFSIEGRGWSLTRSTVANHAIDLFMIKSDIALLSAEQWVKEVASEAQITQAWVVNSEYDYWQNAFDPLQYTANGRSYDHLPMRPNGLPPPLNKDIIDTSQNPGRRVMHVGYIEAVGSPMWLGPGFWKLTGADKQRLIDEPWANCVETAEGLLRIQPSDEPFASAEGEAGEIQRRLRSLLYPLDGIGGRA